PQSVPMPDLIALSVQQAGIILEENGMCPGKRSDTYSASVAKDHVIAQVPSPGTITARGECVNLLVSLGGRPRVYKMPDLQGLSLGQALTLIQKANLFTGEVNSDFKKFKTRNSILRQEPPAGQNVLEGSFVNLVVNREPGRNDLLPLTGPTYGKLFRYRCEVGFLKRHIRIELVKAGETDDFFDDYVSPGEEVWLVIPSDKDTIVCVYEDEQLTGYWSLDAGHWISEARYAIRAAR
ncbi:MAG: PASTA domain-containing protein, partial [Desulfobacterales bacterium]